VSDDFELELKQIFLEEAVQILEDAEAAFLNLETDPSPATIDEIFRIAHTFKGSSKAAGFEEIGQFTHEFETLLTKFRSGEFNVNQAAVSLFLRSLDHIRLMVDGLRADLAATFDSSALIAEIVGFGPDTSTQIEEEGSAEAAAEETMASMSDEEAMAALAEMDSPIFEHEATTQTESIAVPSADAFDDEPEDTFMEATLSTVDEVRGQNQTEDWQKEGDWELKFSEALSSFSGSETQASAPKVAQDKKPTPAPKKANPRS
jgi:chemotaxis protein histidine kinase CheA